MKFCVLDLISTLLENHNVIPMNKKNVNLNLSPIFFLLHCFFKRIYQILQPCKKLSIKIIPNVIH